MYHYLFVDVEMTEASSPDPARNQIALLYVDYHKLDIGSKC